MTRLLHGSIHHLPIWFFYSGVNFIGLILCAIYAYSLFRDRRYFNAVDIGVLNLLSGIFVMCIFCSAQCLRNLVGWSEYFQDWGDGAGCSLEAIGHVVAIMVQFLAVTQIAYYQYCTVRRGQMRQTTSIAILPYAALFHVACIWVYAISGTILTMIRSDMQLLPAGSYCFPGWTSAMALWLAVTMVISLTSAIYLYRRVFRITNEIAETVAVLKHRPAGSAGDPTRHIRAGARRSVYLMLGYAIGWGFVPVACVWAWVYGDITETLELLVGILGSLHSWFVPLVYGKQAIEVSKFIRRCGTYKCCPVCIKARCDRCFPRLEERIKNTETREVTVVMKRHKSNHLPKLLSPPQMGDHKSSNTATARQTLTVSSMLPLPPPAYLLDPHLTIAVFTDATDPSPLTGSPNMDPRSQRQQQYSPSIPVPSSVHASVKVAWAPSM